MRAQVTILALHKGGGAPHEYEDAVWVGSRTAEGPERGLLPPPGPACRSGGVGRVASLRAAVADGASSSLLARRWAQLLVREAGGAPTGLLRTGQGFAEVLTRAADRWPDLMKDYVRNRELRGKPITWFERPGLEAGAHATLLVAHFAAHRWAPARGTWSAVALGDACLFQVRHDRLHVAFPLTASGEFGNTPPLAASGGQDPEAVRARAGLVSGHWRRGDRFYLASDAMAAWFLRQVEVGRKPWDLLRALDYAGPRDLAAWVERRRGAGELRNDDVTLVRIAPR
ncbi:hypothetical protein [Yinghuangia seranimata]|uniref:hypothetical protein n=1 Tax=Yinghuangia seranimata TaxID=408067 RepID=UPI00248B31AF|nr:hypothetical protein [Yinghuangia seranimata]MDI2132152.1 hypothetical protein [Yinghuangia seranimata]